MCRRGQRCCSQPAHATALPGVRQGVESGQCPYRVRMPITAGATYTTYTDKSVPMPLGCQSGESTLTAIRDDYVWDPPQRSVTVPPASVDQDFVGYRILQMTAVPQPATPHGLRRHDYLHAPPAWTGFCWSAFCRPSADEHALPLGHPPVPARDRVRFSDQPLAGPLPLAAGKVGSSPSPCAWW